MHDAERRAVLLRWLTDALRLQSLERVDRDRVHDGESES